MKTKNRFTYGILGLIMLGAFACQEPKEEVLIWTDTITGTDSIYQNPIFEPDLADPTIIRASDGYFYAYGTENQWAPGDNRVTPIIKSDDMKRWVYVSDAFTSKPTWHEGGWIWAPQITFSSTLGKYFLFYSFSGWGDSNPGVGVASSSNPEGPFDDMGKILDVQSSGVPNSIDPFYIETGAGRTKKNYLFWGSFRGIWGVEMSSINTAKMSTKFKIAGNSFEATYIYLHEGKYFFFGSSGNCCDGANSKYHLTVAAADKITGPYLTKDGVDIAADGVEGTLFLEGDDKTWVGPGHNGEIIQDDDGRYFIIYHAIRKDNPLLPSGATRRPLMMDEIIWVDGWPTIKGDVPSSTITHAPRFNKQ